jgi:hypothetical protein
LNTRCAYPMRHGLRRRSSSPGARGIVIRPCEFLFNPIICPRRIWYA